MRVQFGWVSLIIDQSECLVCYLFLHWMNSFLYCLKKTALLLTNQNGEIFLCILLGTETCACIDIKWANISMLLLTKVSGNCDNVSFNWSTVLTFSERYSALDINNREAGICSSRCNSNHCKITAMHWKLTQQKIWEQLNTNDCLNFLFLQSMANFKKRTKCHFF
mgnify:CR=1 FL=1